MWAADVIYMAVQLHREEEDTKGKGGHKWRGLILLCSISVRS